VSTFTEARILALRARADDELTLLTRDSDPTYQTDYATTAAGLAHLLDRSGGDLVAAERRALARAKSAFASYSAVHTQIRQDDNAGNLAGAVTLASGGGTTQLPTVSSELTSALSGGIDVSQNTFIDTTSGAGSDLDGLLWGLAVGAILVTGLVLIGFQPRITEYR
jgi:hypothetical protein